MRRLRRSRLKPWMKRHPCLARLYGLGAFLLFPVLVIGMALWDCREDIKDAFREVLAGTFLPWED